MSQSVNQLVSQSVKYNLGADMTFLGCLLACLKLHPLGVT